MPTATASTKLTTTPNSPLRDPRIERFLEELGFSAKQWMFVEKYPLDHIDKKSSRTTEHRLKPIQSDLVDPYTRDMKAGAQFPPLIIGQVGDRDLAADGNQRHAAADKAGVKVLPAYVLPDISDAQLREIVAAANQKLNGGRYSEDEALVQALRLVADGASYGSAARATGLSESKVRDEKRYENAFERLTKLGLQGFRSARQRNVVVTYDRLGNDEVLKAAVNVAKERNMTDVVSTQHFVQDILRAGKTAIDQMPVIEAWKKKSLATPTGNGTNAKNGKKGKAQISAETFLHQMEIRIVSLLTMQTARGKRHLATLTSSRKDALTDRFTELEQFSKSWLKLLEK